jgi:nucleoside-diphosphate-sugar epimerase
MRVLLTGGSGFVGLALTEALTAAGARVTNFSPAPPPAWAPQGEHIRADVRDRQALDAALRATRAEAVVHAAALTPNEAVEREGDAATVVAINTGGTVNVIEAAAAAGVRRVMAFSSVAVYGRTADEVEALDEFETCCAPPTLYAITKFAAERLALRLGALRGVEVVAPRLGAAWGPWEHRTAARATPSPAFQIVERMRLGAPVVLPGPARAPLVYAPDAAAALARLLTAPGAAGQAVNVGVAETVALEDFAAAVARRHPAPVATEGAPTVAMLAANRPPMRLARLTALIGPPPATPLAAAVDRYLDWLDALPDPGAPFKRL